MDKLTPSHRSWNMSRIKGKNTKPEMIVRSWLHRNGYRYRLHAKELTGKPDIVFRGKKIAIFVHGCFWHRHENCRIAYSPKTKTEFWQKKFAENVARDQRNQAQLIEMGWTVHVIWECEIRTLDFMENLARILKTDQGNEA